MGKTKIEWCDTVWNPTSGCSPVSEGCENCWARRFSKRLAGRCGYPKDEPFRVTLHPDRLEEPLRWKKPRRVFVVSMADLFHPDVPDWFVFAVWRVMALTPQHTYMLLTKRPQRTKEWFEKLELEGKLTKNPSESHKFGLNVLQNTLRREILVYIGNDRKSFEEIKEKFNLNDQMTNFHLNMLEDALYIEKKEEESKIFYFPTLLGEVYLENVEMKRGSVKSSGDEKIFQQA